MARVDNPGVKIFGDGADLPGMLRLYRQPFINGFTTNPALDAEDRGADERPIPLVVRFPGGWRVDSDERVLVAEIVRRTVVNSCRATS